MIKDIFTLPITENKILISAYACLNTKQGDNIDMTVACAESVSNVIHNVFPDFPITPSTAGLYQELLVSPYFEKANDFQPGDIIISPTGLGKNPDMPHGHVGITGYSYMFNPQGLPILSNNSATGLFDIHYSITSWIARYRTLGGYPCYSFRLKK